MRYTISDFYWTYDNSLKLIAGEGGMANPVSGCSILDYELVPNLKDKYFRFTPRDKQLVLATFLYAKDNPFLLIDAVKQLYQKKASGLAIKNVFKLQIPESVIRYANAKNFPIFLIESNHLRLEEIVYNVKRQNELLSDNKYFSEVLTDTLEQELSPSQIRLNALKLNMSFRNRFFCIYAEPDDFLTSIEISKCIENYRNSTLYTNEDFIAEFRKGIVIVKSGEYFTNQDQYTFVKAIFKEVFGKERPNRTGISDIHNGLMDFRKALQEAIYSAYFSANDGYHYHYYEDIGIYRLVFTSLQDEASLRFSNAFIEPIEEYDAENKTELLNTLMEYIRSDLDYSKTAAILNQHEQTIRYRIKRVCDIIGLNHKSQPALEQLSIATKIYLAKKMLSYSGI